MCLLLKISSTAHEHTIFLPVAYLFNTMEFSLCRTNVTIHYYRVVHEFSLLTCEEVNDRLIVDKTVDPSWEVFNEADVFSFSLFT